jgi:hypothetical protein
MGCWWNCARRWDSLELKVWSQELGVKSWVGLFFEAEIEDGEDADEEDAAEENAFFL